MEAKRVPESGAQNSTIKSVLNVSGAYHIFEYPRILIDLAGILELKQYYFDQNLIVGAGITLTDLLTLFNTISKEREEFGYLEKLYEHLNLVANIPVRNVSFGQVIYLFGIGTSTYLNCFEKCRPPLLIPDEIVATS